MFLAIALIMGVLGAGIVFLDKENIERGGTRTTIFIVLAAVYTLFGWWALWSGMPTFAYPLFGWYLGLLIIYWIITAVVGIIHGNTESYDAGWSHGWWFPIVAFIAIIVTALSGAAIFRAQDYAALIGQIDEKTEKHWSQDIQPLDPKHTRLVPAKLALSLAKTALTNGGSAIGSQFPLSEDNLTLQKIKGDYWYLVPMDFHGFKVWTGSKHKGAPGYVKVSATDPYMKPQLVLNQSLIYTPNACFDYNLERHLYPEFKDKILKDYSFEEDDNGNIFWVISVCRPTIAYGGQVVEGVVLCDPKTGQYEFVSKDQAVSNPKYSWIDRVYPEDVIATYIDDWGEYKDGWWNSAWQKLNLLEGETPTINYSTEGICVFVTPVTSTSTQDQTMTGLMYTDSRTGKSIYYTVSGGATEEAVIQAVNNATGYKNWHGSEQIVYENIYGKLAALVPVLGENGNYQGLSIVENENKRCALGVTPSEAFAEFQKMIMSSGGQMTPDNAKNVLEFTGKVLRLGWDISSTGKQYYLYCNGFKQSFMVSSNLQSELALTKEGDEVYIKYLDSQAASIPAIFFNNVTLGLEASSNQKAVQKDMLDKQESIRKKADVKDFREKVEEMSDEDLQKLMKKSN